MDTATIVVVCVLAVVLLVAIAAGAAAIWFVLRKLQQIYNDVSELQDDRDSKMEKGTPDSQQNFNGSAIALTDVGVVDGRSQSVILETGGETSPVIELKIEKEVVSVYGKKPEIGQVMMTAQHYYQSHTNKVEVCPAECIQVMDRQQNVRLARSTVFHKDTEVCPAECIQVMDRQQNVRLARSTVFHKDWLQGTPTSLLLQGSAQSFENVLNHNKGLFVHRTIGPKGGQLFVSGVRLTIPAGALSEDTLITLGITWDEQYMPAMSKRQALLSPIVLCQPSGKTFNVPVRLSFPHAADQLLENWNPSILKRAGDLNGESDWTTITLDDYDERLVTETRVKLTLKHFTLYTCIGVSKQGKVAVKLMHIVAFAGKLTRNSFFKPRLYCLNSYKDELPEVEKLETKLDPFSKPRETTDLLVRDTEEDVVVELAKMSEEWRLAGDKIETLSFELAWHAFHPHCAFVLRPETTSVTEIVCEFHSYQRGNENNPAKLKIAEQIAVCIYRVYQKQELSPSSPLYPDGDDPLSKLTCELAILLDPVTDTGNDWRNLADRMGCDLARIRWLTSATSSPTKVLLDKWMEDGRPVDELERHLLDMERPDAAEEVRKYMATTDSNPRQQDEPTYLTLRKGRYSYM